MSELETYRIEKEIAQISERIEFFKRIRDQRFALATEKENESKYHRGYGYEIILRNEAERFLENAIRFEERISEEEERLRSLISKKEVGS